MIETIASTVANRPANSASDPRVSGVSAASDVVGIKHHERLVLEGMD